MKSHKVFISCLPGDEKYAYLKGYAVQALRGVEVVTSQAAYAPEDLESAYAYFLIVTPAYLQSLWMNFEMGVALSRNPRDEAHVVPVLRNSSTTIASTPA